MVNYLSMIWSINSIKCHKKINNNSQIPNKERGVENYEHDTSFIMIDRIWEQG